MICQSAHYVISLVLLLMSFLLLLLCGSCTHVQIERAAQSQPLAAPPLKMVMRSQAVEIQND